MSPTLPPSVTDAWRRSLPRRRKRIDYAPALRSSAGELINGVRTAFEQLCPRAEANEEETKKAIASAVHLIVVGLSRATAHPPAWFRLAGRPMGLKSGRPPVTEGKFIAWECRQHFERITGRDAKVDTDPETKKPNGAFYDLVVSVFRALAIPDSAETCARAACYGQRTRTRRNIGVVRT